MTRWIHDPVYKKAVVKLLNRMVEVELPQIPEATSDQSPQVPLSMENYPIDAKTARKNGEIVRGKFNVHRCTFTCFKKKHRNCRMGFKRRHAMDSFIEEITKNPQDPEKGCPVFRPDGVRKPENKSKYTIGYKEERPIVFGLRRPTEQDRLNVETNNFLAGLLRCNSNAQVQMSEVQAKYSIYYIGHYMSKSPVEVENLYSIVHAAIKAARKYPSKAEDSGTPVRTAKYLLTKKLNKLVTLVEVSDQQVMMSLLGRKSFYSSHEFTNCYVWNAVKKFCSKMDEGERNPDDSLDQLRFDEEPGRETYSINVDSNKKAFKTDQFMQYKYRNKKTFGDLCYYDFCALVRTDKIARDPAKTFRGRTSSVKHRMNRAHKQLYETCWQYLRSKMFVPMMIGGAPPAFPGDQPDDRNGDDWKKWIVNAKRFVSYYAILFLPFDDAMDPRDPTNPDLRILPWHDRSWSNFMTILESWIRVPLTENPARSWYRRSSFEIIHNMVRGLRFSTENQNLMRKFRYASATKQSDQRAHVRKVDFEYDAFAPELGDELDFMAKLMDAQTRAKFSSRMQKNLIKLDLFMDGIRNVFEQVYGSVGTFLGIGKNHKGPLNSDSDGAFLSSLFPNECTNLLQKILNQEDEDTMEEENGSQTSKSSNPLPAFLKQTEITVDDNLQNVHNLTIGQNRAIDSIVAEIKSKRQLRALLHGGPGVGKTTVCKLLKQKLLQHNLNLNIVFTATTGVAASQHKGFTVHSYLKLYRRNRKKRTMAAKINLTKPLNAVTLDFLRDQLKNVDMLILDEMSMLTPKLFVELDNRLRQIRGNDIPFGGLHILLVGDFYQFSPI